MKGRARGTKTMTMEEEGAGKRAQREKRYEEGTERRALEEKSHGEGKGDANGKRRKEDSQESDEGCEVRKKMLVAYHPSTY